MNIYLIRHGEAEPTSDNSPHEERALTNEGIIILRNSAQLWKNFIAGFDIILSSPLKRAKQTAEIIKDIFATKTEVVLELSLLNGGYINDLLNLAAALDLDNIAMVGHQPDISKHIGAIIGVDDIKARILPGTIVKVSFNDKPKVGKGKLEFLIPPVNKKG